jgi:hypothetical protein
LIEPSKTHMFNHDAIMQLISQQIEAKPPTWWSLYLLTTTPPLLPRVYIYK